MTQIALDAPKRPALRKVCAKCGHKKKLEMDHIVPVVRGGTGDISNLQPLCRSCNASKHDETIDYRTEEIKSWLLENAKE